MAPQTSETEQVVDLNSWLPITASRKAKWWYSAFHNVTAMVGAGVLGLPFALSQLGWIPGIVAILGSWLITFYTLWQLVELHEAVPGKRFDRYPELGEHAFGPKLGYWIVMPQQTCVQVASTIVYSVTGGKSLKNYSMVAFIASTIRGSHHHPATYGVRSHTTAGQIFDVLNGIGTIAFAYAGHSVVLEIQATIPSTQKNTSKKPMWKGCVVAYIIVALCYLAVSISGFWAFGNVFAMPVFDMLESCLVQKLHFTPGRALRFAGRSTYVAITGFIALCIPFFGGLLGFFGGLVFASTSYFTPCIIWLVLKKPNRWSFHWIASWISIIIGVLIAVLAPIGGIRQIIISAKTYKFFS
ncbi:lysine histidine transporter-like 5 [Quercus suber]|uniref:Lysine histidine transporter-like 5 n=1 Tax=Quercus suber TaxID=58331 RepID=A0AAW0KUI6_QUESU